GLGLALNAALIPAEAGRAPAETAFAGPAAEGELVRAELHAGGGSPVLTGRVVDETGAPAAARTGRLWLTHGADGEERWLAAFDVETDGDGAFEVALAEPVALGGLAARGTGEPPPAEARVRLRLPARDGAAELVLETAV